MEALRELVELITRKRVKKVELFDEQSRNKNSNYYQLFEGIHTSKYASDEEASQDIYQCEASAKKYLILKTRLKQKLLNTLFFLDIDDQDNLSPKEVALYECGRGLYHAKVLLQNQSDTIAIPIIEKIYKKAREHALTEIEYDCAKILTKYYGESQNFKDFINFKNITERLEKKLFAENRAERFYLETQITYQKSKSHRETAQKLAQSYIQIIKEDLQKYKSQLLENYLLKLQTLQGQFDDNFSATLHSLNQQEQLYYSKPEIYAQEQIALLQIEKMGTFLQLKDYTQSEQYYQSLSETEFNEAHWFEMQELRLLLALHTQQYIQAAEVFKVTIEHNNFRLLSEENKQKWTVFQAYLHYCYRYLKQKNVRLLIQNTKLNFKLSEFVDDRPLFSKAQRGLNIASIALQVLYYLERQDTTSITDCTQALDMYRRRYPKKDEYFRSECLINMMIEMKEQDFRFYQTRKKTDKIYQELKKSPSKAKNESKFIEVFPYEFIWESILEKLKNFRYG